MIKLYECKALRAKLTLEACAANRARPAYSAHGDTIRHPACKLCKSWKNWDTEKPSIEIKPNDIKLEAIKREETMPETEKPKKICKDCGNEVKYLTFGLCRNCYLVAWRKAKKAGEDTRLASALAAASEKEPILAVQAKDLGQIEEVINKVKLELEAEFKVNDTRLETKPELKVNEPHRIYLACPYTHQNSATQEKRAALATKAARKLIGMGYNVFSPLTHGHEICAGSNLPTDFEFWRNSCLSYLNHWATMVYVLTIPGWEESRGVREELSLAKTNNISVSYILPLALDEEAEAILS